jgi:hypothetical protein
MSAVIDRIIEKLFGEKLVQCTERFKLNHAHVSCINGQLIATAEIAAHHGEEISGATMYVVHSAEENDVRAFGAALGPPQGEPTTFKLPLALTASLAPFNQKDDMKVFVIIALSTPGTDTMCFLDKEVSLVAQAR